MVERGAAADEINHFGPCKELRDYISERLKVSKRMDRKIAAGKEFSVDINKRDRSLRVKKVRILNAIVFQAMADLTFFFESVALRPELQEVFDFDIKDLLGVRRNSSQEYGFMLLRLLRSILIIEGGQSEQRPTYKRDDFRLKLNNILQGIVLDKVGPYLLKAFKNSRAEHVVWEDLARAWAWTEMLAIDKEYGDPHRTFEFKSSELLE